MIKARVPVKSVGYAQHFTYLNRDRFNENSFTTTCRVIEAAQIARMTYKKKEVLEALMDKVNRFAGECEGPRPKGRDFSICR